MRKRKEEKVRQKDPEDEFSVRGNELFAGKKRGKGLGGPQD